MRIILSTLIEPWLVHLKCYGISHKHLDHCQKRPKKCVIYAEAHLANEYQWGVNGCNKRKEKLCIYIIAWYTNCQGNYQASSVQCLLRLKAQIQARKDYADRIFKPPKNTRSTMREIRKEKSPVTSDLDKDVEGEK